LERRTTVHRRQLQYYSSIGTHTHLDQGSFVFATQGQVFAQDLVSGNYAAPGYRTSFNHCGRYFFVATDSDIYEIKAID